MQQPSYTEIRITGLTLAETVALTALGYVIDTRGHAYKRGSVTSNLMAEEVKRLCPNATVEPVMIEVMRQPA